MYRGNVVRQVSRGVGPQQTPLQRGIDAVFSNSKSYPRFTECKYGFTFAGKKMEFGEIVITSVSKKI